MKKQTVTASFPNGIKVEISKEKAKKILVLQKWIKSKNKAKT